MCPELLSCYQYITLLLSASVYKTQGNSIFHLCTCNHQHCPDWQHISFCHLRQAVSAPFWCKHFQKAETERESLSTTLIIWYHCHSVLGTFRWIVMLTAEITEPHKDSMWKFCITIKWDWTSFLPGQEGQPVLSQPSALWLTLDLCNSVTVWSCTIHCASWPFIKSSNIKNKKENHGRLKGDEW